MGGHDSLDAPESETVKRLDQLIDAHIDVQATTRDLAAAVKELISRDTNQNNVTVTHKTEGMSAWGAAGVTACFCTMVMLLAALFIIMPELHDLKAWEQIHQNHINALEAKEKTK